MIVYDAVVDPVSALLDGPRARQAFMLRALLAPPWSLQCRDESPVTVIAMLRGAAWVVPEGGAPVPVAPHGVAVIKRQRAYTICDEPGLPPQVIIHPGQRCTTPDGVDLHDALALGTRSWGTDPSGTTTMLVGVYGAHQQVTEPLLDLLPEVAVVPPDALVAPIVALLDAELRRDAPGQDAVLDRLLDVLLITSLRCWFEARDPGLEPDWYAAHGDPEIGPAIRLLHDQPHRHWTVAGLAAEIGMSRAAFARRFTELVGVPPITHLTTFRLALAADLLCEPGSTLASVARQVGYRSPYALSAAFSRTRGVTPSGHRAANA